MARPTPPKPAGKPDFPSRKNVLPLAAQSRYNRTRKVAYHLSEPASAPCDIPAKNRVRGFFSLSNKQCPANRRQSPQPRRKIGPVATKTVSGIPYWTSRDPIGEYGGINLYGFVGNDGINKWDLNGLWTDIKREGKAWARTCAESGDTWDSLASLVKLEKNEARKWVKNYTNTPISDAEYYIPNTVFAYTAQLSLLERLSPSKLLWYMQFSRYTKVVSILEFSRNMIIDIAKANETKGYNVILQSWGNSNDEWIGGWKKDGIYKFLSSTHGNNAGIVFPEPDNDIGVEPYSVYPPYKLSLVTILACGSVLEVDVPKRNVNINTWRDHVSRNGKFIGYYTHVHSYDIAHKTFVGNGTGKGVAP